MLFKQYFQTLDLSEEHEDYLLARAAKHEQIQKLSIKTFRASPELKDPSLVHLGDFRQCDNTLVFPYLSPRNDIVFFELRDIHKKRIFKIALPNSYYTSFFGGLNLDTMTRIWEGCDVWLVEGMFDLFALTQILPENQVVLSSLRAGLSKEQLQFFHRFVKGRVRLLYDNDAAGRIAIYGKKDQEGILSKLTSLGLKVDVPVYVGKDPGDIWMTQGIYGLRKHLNFGV